MNPANVSTVGSRERRIGLLADELRAETANGLHYHPDDGDTERFVRLRGLTARLLAEVDHRDADVIETAFAVDRGLRTPLLAVVLILSHQRDGLMLAADPDTGVPAAPARFVALDQDPDTAVRELAREVLPDEEVVPVPHGICDSIAAGLPISHTYYLTYVVDLTFVPVESRAVELVPAEKLTVTPEALTEYILDGADRQVIDAPLNLPSTVAELLTGIAAVASEGLEATADRYNVERYRRIAETAELILTGDRDESPLVRADFGPLDVETPLAAAEMLILDGEERILLMKRADCGQWAMPGGACEVGETSAATAVRECREELGIEVTVDGLAGVYDNRVINAPNDDGFVCFVYIGRLDGASPPPRHTHEAVDFGWFEPHELAELDVFNAHDVKIQRALKVIAG